MNMARLACELTVLEGLEAVAAAEIERAAPEARLRSEQPGALRYDGISDLDALLDLRSVVAPFLVVGFPVPRPKALLGHQHFQTLVAAIEQVRALWHPDTFTTLRLNAAGEDSPVMLRLRQELANHFGLMPSDDKTPTGDLVLRLRRGPAGDWEALIRLTPFPLSTRAWRICNFPGALNATVAHAMMDATDPSPQDRVLNLACGSGTLLIERLLQAPARLAIGCDTDTLTLACARENVAAARLEQQIRLESWDVTALPLADASVDVICADLPFGQLIGTHSTNETLYPAVLAEATRVMAPGGRMVLISHEVRLLEAAFDAVQDAWDIDTVQRVRVGGMTPRVVLARRRSDTAQQ